jgi:ferredoxin|uniref:glutamate synthase (NADPH) n=1 Tax=Desulfobacca acetoxidans TaxID=60893 RepID=A0A7V6A2M7_9BACT
MPAKYHIHIQPTAPRFPAHGKSTVLDWGEGCVRCTRCVKETCPYHAFDQRDFDRTSLTDTIDSVCKNCFRCVQGCPRELVSKTLNPQYEEMGDAYWTPEILLSTWYQAETGKIPVSGAGYGGPFSGDGFDAIWTDMSEIVRPTRDGIHGREYISTAVDLGRHPLFLMFDQDDLAFEPSPVVEIPLPILLGEPPFGAGLPRVLQASLTAARNLGTLMVVTRSQITQKLAQTPANLIPSFPAGTVELDDHLLSEVRLVEILDSDNIVAQVDALKRRYPDLVCMVKVPADGRASRRAADLASAGAEIIHLAASPTARGSGDVSHLHLKDLIRQTHLRLVELKLRDTVTILASGGIAMAEHVAKAIICGADGVVVDVPLLIALECRVCGNCLKGEPCPVQMDKVEIKQGAQRLMNLMGAWNNQLLEVLGAMGIREVRRLRGEVGRAMFVEELQKEIFAPLFARPAAEMGDRRAGE